MLVGGCTALLETVTYVTLAEILKANHNSIKINVFRRIFKERNIEDYVYWTLHHLDR